MRSRLIRTAAMVALVALAACGTDQDPAIDIPSTSTPTSTPADNSSTTTLAFSGATTPVSVAAHGTVAHLTDLRVAGHPGYDRIAFEFRQPVPGYTVKYIDRPITEDGSGNEVAIDGGAVLEVRFEPASTFDMEAGSSGQSTYDGPRRVKAGDSRAVTEVVRTGDFEAVLTWVVGVDRTRPFKVTVTASPKHVLIIDIGTA